MYKKMLLVIILIFLSALFKIYSYESYLFSNMKVFNGFEINDEGLNFIKKSGINSKLSFFHNSYVFNNLDKIALKQ